MIEQGKYANDEGKVDKMGNVVNEFIFVSDSLMIDKLFRLFIHSSIHSFLPNSVIILDGILERLEESFKTTISHREIINLSTENKLVI